MISKEFFFHHYITMSLLHALDLITTFIFISKFGYLGEGNLINRFFIQEGLVNYKIVFDYLVTLPISVLLIKSYMIMEIKNRYCKFIVRNLPLFFYFTFIITPIWNYINLFQVIDYQYIIPIQQDLYMKLAH